MYPLQPRPPVTFDDTNPTNRPVTRRCVTWACDGEIALLSSWCAASSSCSRFASMYSVWDHYRPARWTSFWYLATQRTLPSGFLLSFLRIWYPLFHLSLWSRCSALLFSSLSDMLLSSHLSFLCLLSMGFLFSFAQVVPTTPGPNETYIADSNCTVAWNPDTGGTWTNMSIGRLSVVLAITISCFWHATSQISCRVQTIIWASSWTSPWASMVLIRGLRLMYGRVQKLIPILQFIFIRYEHLYRIL